ncbi:transcriptional regulator [Rhizobacter sp. OV335]|uniref:winged helix-turn-helix domain-containing protein n=1 Tax=Rhizobacter sp. OV335 TaxID=1500264 RepID=UPI0009227313|nr:transcriptional regulator [Rhizobacter sp. OV335]SHM25794.1 Transcriptional regulatory protein, C terminal [Rhizobacter sp. OV335]
MPNDELQVPREPGSWRFGDFELDAAQRVLTRAGLPVHLSTRAFEVLRYLVRHHPRTVPRAELLAQCWPQREVTEGAVARIMMSLRTALGDADPQQGSIRTVPRAGYRFAAPVLALAGKPLASTRACDDAASPPAAVRVAVLPVDNRSADPQLAWVELGMASLLGTCLEQLHVEGGVAVRQALMAWAALPPALRADTPRCARAIAQSLGAQTVLEARLGQQQGSCVLHLTLHGDGAVLQQGIVLADGAAEVAQVAAGLVARWLDPPDDAHMPIGADLDLGDAFLNEAWQRVLRRGSDESLLEAEHLLDMLCDAGADAPVVDLEQARIALLLGRPHASQALQRIEARAARHGDSRLRVEVLLLQALHLEQLGQAVQALEVSRAAAALAAGPRSFELPLELPLELQLRAAVACARQTTEAQAGVARAMLAQTIRRVEVCGNRILLRDACVALGHAAAADEDGVAALRHHALGLAAAQTLHESARAAPLLGLSHARLQMGLLSEAQALGVEALRCARLSGAQPVQGQAAIALAGALQARRETQALRELLSTLDDLADDRSVAMRVARESRCRAVLLSLAGRHDEALACIAQARQASRRHPVLAAVCVQDRLQVLLAARRFDEVQALCLPLIASGTACLDARLVPWLELAMACCEHVLQADPGIALQRLEALLARRASSQAHAMAGLAAAWIDLEAGRVAHAAARVASLHAWTEQCPAGRRVAARLQQAMVDADGARPPAGDRPVVAWEDLPQLLWQAA